MSQSDLEQGWLERLNPAHLLALDGQVVAITGAAGGVGSYLAAGFGLAVPAHC